MLSFRAIASFNRNSNIMRPPTFDAKILRQYLRRHKIATHTDLKRVLDTDVDITVFRKLKLLDYRTSYTHRGSYYTLNEVAHFDDSGLWSHEAVWFSRYGTLLLTVEHFVNHSPRGFFASELADVVHAEVHDALHQLVQQERLQRTEVNGVYLYTSIDPSTHRRQFRAQRTAQSVPVVSDVTTLQVSPDEVKASILLFYSLLNEQQRRLYAGLESIKLGRGGDTLLADLLDLGCSYRSPWPSTTAQPRRRFQQNPPRGWRTRSDGKKTPEIISIIEYLLRHDIAGDPMTDLKWCRRTTGKIADLLGECGLAI